LITKEVHEMIIYSLLYIDDVNNKNTNLKGSTESADIYVSCAALCSMAFRAAGMTFRLITNDERYVTGRLDALQMHGVMVVEHKFTLNVPKKVPFYSAHFKIDIYGAFGRGEFGDQVGLVDLDTILFRPLTWSNELAVYDITTQMLTPDSGLALVSDMEKISGRNIAEPRWYGGEFMMGPRSAFASISRYVELYWPSYVEHIGSLHHTSDEMIMSTALNVARVHGFQTADYGRMGLVARWWTARTEHRQVPFKALENVALLHLPADKEFLARQAKYRFDGSALLSRFRRYARRKVMLRSLAGAGELMLGMRHKFAPRLSSRHE
jgi:hypothetical protein